MGRKREVLVNGLTKTERAIYDAIESGKTPYEIAEERGIRVKSVTTQMGYIKNALEKVGKIWNYPRFSHKTKANNPVLKERKEITFEEESREELANQKAAAWKKKYKQSLTTSAFEGNIFSLFESALTGYKQKKRMTKTRKHTPSNEELVLMLSDWHGGEQVVSEEVLGMNEYNVDIMVERVERMSLSIDSILDKMSGYDYTKLNLFILGDMVSGAIHEELLMGGVTSVEQVIVVAETIAELIYRLLDRFHEIEVTGVIGNHGRMSKKPTYKKAFNNFDWLVYKFVEVMFAEVPEVAFNIPKASMAMKKIFDFNFLLTHGNGIRSFGGIPFYGIRRMDSNISQTLVTKKDMYPHFIAMGHFHTSNQIEKNGGKIIMNGTLKGGDEFALGAMHTMGGAAQTMFSVHETNGITWSMDINCD